MKTKIRCVWPGSTSVVALHNSNLGRQCSTYLHENGFIGKIFQLQYKRNVKTKPCITEWDWSWLKVALADLITYKSKNVSILCGVKPRLINLTVYLVAMFVWPNVLFRIPVVQLVWNVIEQWRSESGDSLNMVQVSERSYHVTNIIRLSSGLPSKRTKGIKQEANFSPPCLPSRQNYEMLLRLRRNCDKEDEK